MNISGTDVLISKKVINNTDIIIILHCKYILNTPTNNNIRLEHTIDNVFNDILNIDGKPYDDDLYMIIDIKQKKHIIINIIIGENGLSGIAGKFGYKSESIIE